MFLEPEDGAKRAQEENTFDSDKCNHMLGKTSIGGVAPLGSPVGFASDTCYSVHGTMEVHLLCWVLAVHVDETMFSTLIGKP